MYGKTDEMGLHNKENKDILEQRTLNLSNLGYANTLFLYNQINNNNNTHTHTPTPPHSHTHTPTHPHPHTPHLHTPPHKKQFHVSI